MLRSYIVGKYVLCDNKFYGNTLKFWYYMMNFHPVTVLFIQVFKFLFHFNIHVYFNITCQILLFDY